MDHHILIMLFIGLSGIFEIFTVAEDNSVTKLPPLNCKKVMMVVGSKQFKAFGKCSKELKEKVSSTDEYQKRINCIAKCAMASEKMLDSNAQINMESVNAFLDEFIPKEYHKFAHDILDSCMSKFEGKLDQKDKYCSTYGNFVKCMQDKAVEVLSSDMCIQSSPRKEASQPEPVSE